MSESSESNAQGLPLFAEQSIVYHFGLANPDDVNSDESAGVHAGRYSRLLRSLAVHLEEISDEVVLDIVFDCNDFEDPSVTAYYFQPDQS